MRITESEKNNMRRLHRKFSPINEQTTGTTSGGLPVCMMMTSQGCPGTPNANLQMVSSNTKCATIDNIPVTANDVGRTIMAPMGGQMMVVQSVTTNVNGNGSDNVSSAPGPCPRPNTSTGTNTGTTTGTTGGPTPPPKPTQSTCKKSCQQLAPRWKKIVRKNISDQKNKCRWLKRILEKLEKKLSTAKNKCQIKRIKCKTSVIRYHLKNC